MVLRRKQSTDLFLGKKTSEAPPSIQLNELLCPPANAGTTSNTVR